MSGLSAIKSKIRLLNRKTNNNSPKRSVLRYSEYAEYEKSGVWPDDIFPGILLAPD